MTTEQIAKRLVELCREGKWFEAQSELYSEEIESVEPEGTPWGSVKGMEALKKKGEQWSQSVEEVHGSEISQPLVSGNHFVVRMVSDNTFKGMGRVSFGELCLYTVDDGKIIREEFFYTPMQP